MEHYPSFHTYCKRHRSSPTGKTPVHIEKRRQLEFPDQNRSYKKWSKEEKLAMTKFVKEHGLPSANVNKFWEECARYIFQTTGLVKSGASCKSQHARVKSLFPSACLATDESTTISDVSNSSRKNEASTQETEREWSYISVRDKLAKSKIEVETLATKLSDTRLSSFDDVTLYDRATLLHAALYTSTETIAENVLNSESLRKAVKMLLIWEVEQKASSKCIRNESSILYPNRDLTSFSWNDICTELFLSNPLLAEVLLAVALPTCKLGMIQPIRSLLPKLGLVYSILMSNRFVELSLVQKVIAITMKNEQTHEKV
ncbi:hypothetical protein ACJMK2_002108 [Sinanodonta woodiana]|uniref:Myb-like domain-containing protein n=1 Tax=Sinanodonta woodiana TaxID=1069815 RepID=A0ABD3XXJ6_SINWO